MKSLTAWSLFVLAAACGPEIPTVVRPAVVSVIYDPAKGNLPTPNDLALDASGKVTIAPNPELSDAENALKAGFNGLDGFSTASSVRVQFSGALAPATISSTTALAFDLGYHGNGPAAEVGLDRTWADCDNSLTFSAPSGFVPGHLYVFALRSGSTGLKGAAGEEVVESPAFHFLRAGKDLTRHLDALPGATRAEKAATAARLELVRAKLEPHFTLLESKGVPRRELVALWHFTAHTRGEALFDPNSKRIPFPNELLKDPATGLVALPASATDKAEQLALKKGFNQLDGFSTTAALSVEATAPIDRTTITAANVRLFARDSTLEFLELDRVLSADGKKLVLQPRVPLLPGTAYVVVLSNVKDNKGNLLALMPLPSVLTLGQGLLDARGASTLSAFCAPTAAKLEPLRAGIARVLAAAKIPRDGVGAAWTFTTQDILGRARQLWMTPYEKSLPLAVLDAKVTAAALTQPNVSKYVTGKLTTWDRLDPTTRAFREDGGGEQRPIDFFLTLPKSAPAGANVKVLVFGHGLMTERRLAFFVADRLARAGFAVMAIDFPLHGERTACVQDSHCSFGSTCAKDGACMKGGQRAELARGPGYLGVPGAGTPVGTGAAYVDVANLFGTRDHFRQGIIDLSAQLRLIRELDWKPITGGVGLDPGAISYAGISLGGIVGAEISGIEPHLNSMLLNVAGAGMVDLMRESLTFGPTLKQGLKDKGIEEGTPAYEQFVNAARWCLDEIDPINLSPYAMSRPLEYVDPKTRAKVIARPKRLRLQMAIGDTVVPNTSTKRLVKASGIDEATQFRSFLGSHGFLGDPAEPACYPGQDDLAGFLEGN